MRKILRYSFIAVVSLLLLMIGWIAILYWSADMGEPTILVDSKPKEVKDSLGYRLYNESFMHQNDDGLWEVYLKGDPIERGVAFGRLAKPLLYYQEKVFVDQVKEIIPSESYLKFLRLFIIVFNRNLGKYIPEEYRNEIYGMSQSCTSEFNYIGSPYERQLNYHAAHDIGHTMQEYMRVGCSSFGAWGNRSQDSSLIIGRNFDFYVGDNFAKNKMVMFVAPDNGYKYASIGWAGMVGVLSGMNEKGLTVTLNAAKGSIPTSAAMPISILAREILQYASTIEEAYAIAKKRHTFVSESLLIGSANDGKAAIIEKTPDKIGLYEPNADYIICTNHYQSATFSNDKTNIENIELSDSPYRYKRLEKLLMENTPIDARKSVKILRDRQGIQGEDIGLTNEKSVNQSIGHHSVIFKPSQLQMWVSTSPWQSGKFICYDLNTIFKEPQAGKMLVAKTLTIAADSLFLANDYKRIIAFRSLSKQIKQSIKNEKAISSDSLNKLVDVNPMFFHTYEIVGDYYAAFNRPEEAIKSWKKALTLEIPRKGEVESIKKKIKNLSK